MQVTSIEDALQGVGDKLAEDVKASQRKKGLYASGRSARSTKAVVSRQGSIVLMQLRGAKHWRFQQKGRGSNRSGKPSRQMIEELKQWTKDKGIKIPVYAIAMKIAKVGIKVPNKHNPGGVLSEPLNRKRVTGILKTAVRPVLIQSVRSSLFR